MSNSQSPTAATPAPTGASPRVGQPLDLLWLFLFGCVALFFTQGVALVMLVASLRPSHPGLSTQELLRLAAHEAEFNAFFAVPVQTALYALLAVFVYLRVSRVARLPFWPAVAWKPVALAPALSLVFSGVALAVIIQFSTVFFPPPGPLPIEKLFTSRTAALLVLGTSLVVAPFFEELIFRGYIYTVLERAWGRMPAVAVSGTLFGLLHAPQLVPGWIQIGLLCLVGILFSAVRAQTGSTQASFLMHLAYNATIAGLFLSSREFFELARGAGLYADILPLA